MDKIAKFSPKVYFVLQLPKRDLDVKKTTPNIDVCPENLEAVLEY